MSRGFSLVLVSVVMIVMLVFGLLSVSSAGADYRLSKKASVTQKIYYDLDSRGELILASCNGAAADAWNSATEFMNEKKYLDELPAGLKSLASSASKLKNGAANGSNAYSDMMNGAFAYYLKKQLAALSNKDGFAYEVKNGSAAVEMSVSSSLNSNYSLGIEFSCATKKLKAAPLFKVLKWSESVSGTEISDDETLNVWNGK